jgi:uncharacterized protein (DUF433 family)
LTRGWWGERPEDRVEELDWPGGVGGCESVHRVSKIVDNKVAKTAQSCYFGNMTVKDLKGIVQSDPEILGGTPVFVGTRVPLQNLIDYLEGGESIDDFLDGFPSVKREQVIAVIEAGKLEMLEIV